MMLQSSHCNILLTFPLYGKPDLNCFRVSLEYFMSISCFWTGVESSKVTCLLPSVLVTVAQMFTVPLKCSGISAGIMSFTHMSKSAEPSICQEIIWKKWTIEEAICACGSGRGNITTVNRSDLICPRCQQPKSGKPRSSVLLFTLEDSENAARGQEQIYLGSGIWLTCSSPYLWIT